MRFLIPAANIPSPSSIKEPQILIFAICQALKIDILQVKYEFKITSIGLEIEPRNHFQMYYLKKLVSTRDFEKVLEKKIKKIAKEFRQINCFPIIDLDYSNCFFL